ncbi:UPF0496 protein At1g20180-like [Primulina huaijiensis]|uniref:UPF0496 protein At1g20180-like n=1 Tax=Primulina huaijiensis TaxID=1492673 RepID=UPI003CC6ECB4
MSPILSPSLVRHVKLSDYFLEPCHKIPTSIQESMNPHSFSDYFEISLKSCKFCEFLLKNIHQVRINYHEIKSTLKQIRVVPNGSSWTDNEYFKVHEFLTSFASQMNPFSMVKPEEFHELNSCHKLLYQELRSQCNKTKRRNKQTRCIKLVKATFKVVGCGAIAIALIALATHSMTGSMAIIACFLCVLIIKKMKRRLNKTQLERLHAQLDVASKGVYALINDFDTLRQLAMTCDYEMEHMKMLAEISVRKGRNEVFKEVIKELQMQESCFLEHLEEIEKHTYLSILDITRSTSQVMRE